MSSLSNQLFLSNQQLTVRSISVSEMENNVCLLTGKSSGEQVLIDAADSFAILQEFIADAVEQDFLGTGEPEGLVAVLTTHGHWDHIRALKQVAHHYKVQTVAGQADADLIKSQENIEVSTPINGGEIFSFEDFALETISLVGHTPGSIAYVLRGCTETPTVIFSGDSLFPGGVGKTNSPQDFRQLFSDVSDRLFSRFDDNTVVLPGHGNPTTLGVERPHLREWRERGW